MLESYLTAVYARDYRAAYKWISVEDRRHKREVEYLRENPPFSAATLELTRKLAEVIELRDLRTHIEGNRAKLSFLVRLPDANAPGFCFIQITLAPGEEKELPLVFRVHWDTPRNVKEFRVTYDFYPIEKFPETELGGSV